MTAEGDSIIAAAKMYVQQHGKPPARLDDLVPQYLTAELHEARGWKNWVILPKDPGGKDVREFAVRRDIDGPVRRFRTGYTHIVCYVDPTGRQNWYAAGGNLLGSETLFLRASSQ